MARSTGTRLLGVALGAAAAVPAVLAGFSAFTARKVLEAVPQAGRLLQIGGETLHVSDTGGDKPAILLLHGLGGNMLNLLPGLSPLLSRDYRVVAIDRPDSGYSVGAPGRPGNIRAQAWVVRDVIEALGLRKPLVVGHSLGGAIALATALDHPAQVGGLALLTPLTQVETVPPKMFAALAVRNPVKRWLISWTLAVPLGIRRGRRTMEMVFAPEALPRDFAVTGGGLLNMRPSAYRSASRDLVASGDDLPGLVARYPSLGVPVGILFGTEDRVLAPWKHGAAMKALVPDLVYEEIAGAGHMLPFTQPEPTAAFIRKMAEKVAEQPAA
ncbi:alpha/beta hydrolase [Acetobacteraceae bacterium KSS8]|uniref:Alpha/beta hydrolase n=1 Tax=Endosaccharibacter trunci TaxID=2812733 RepID=A0ABT1W8X4_9PROT|nr:alpha/beta hydrolase [Acetobacteraceae bacterium KSS8]